jgi:hypothetical protein
VELTDGTPMEIKDRHVRGAWSKVSSYSVRVTEYDAQE